MSPSPSERHAEESRQMLRGAGAFGALTAASRALGLARDVALTAVLSAAARDAFILAFSIPNMFRNLFGEGALTNSFVPVYVERLEQNDREGANRLASLVASALTVLLAGIAVLGASACLGARHAAELAAKNDLVLRLLQVMAPFLPLVCLYAFFMAVLTSHRRFAVPGGAPILLNLAILAGAWLAWRRYGAGANGGALILAGAVLVGGALQLGVELPSAWRAGVRIRPQVNFRDPALRAVLTSMAPVLIGTGVFQVNTLLNRLFAWGLVPGDGPQSYLALSNLLVTAPLGVVAVALSAAALPVLSSLHARGDRAGFGRAFTGAARMSLFMLVPATAVLLVSGEPIIRLLYERGGWSSEETPRMMRVLFWSALALGPTVVTMLAARAFYAMRRPEVPARIAVITVAVNIGLSLLLVRSGAVWAKLLAGTDLARWLGGPLVPGADEPARAQAALAAEWLSGAAGLALATTLAGCVQMAMLLAALKRARPDLKLGGLGASAARIAGMSVLTGVVIRWVMLSLPPTGEGFIIVAQRGIAPAVAGAFAYTLLASLFDADEYREFWEMIRSKKKKRKDGEQTGKKTGTEDEDDDEE